MKFIIGVTLSLLFATMMAPLVSTLAFASDSTNDLGLSRPDAVSFELLGRGLVYSINYDRLISDELAVGMGISSSSTSARTANGNYYAGGSVPIDGLPPVVWILSAPLFTAILTAQLGAERCWLEEPVMNTAAKTAFCSSGNLRVFGRRDCRLVGV